jgi:hypothetical protein
MSAAPAVAPPAVEQDPLASTSAPASAISGTGIRQIASPPLLPLLLPLPLPLLPLLLPLEPAVLASPGLLFLLLLLLLQAATMTSAVTTEMATPRPDRLPNERPLLSNEFMSKLLEATVPLRIGSAPPARG